MASYVSSYCNIRVLYYHISVLIPDEIAERFLHMASKKKTLLYMCPIPYEIAEGVFHHMAAEGAYKVRVTRDGLHEPYYMT
jgi:hypothetical protein